MDLFCFIRKNIHLCTWGVLSFLFSFFLLWTWLSISFIPIMHLVVCVLPFHSCTWGCLVPWGISLFLFCLFISFFLVHTWFEGDQLGHECRMGCLLPYVRVSALLGFLLYMWCMEIRGTTPQKLALFILKLLWWIKHNKSSVYHCLRWLVYAK